MAPGHVFPKTWSGASLFQIPLEGEEIMKVKTVRFERLKKHSTERFENERVGIEAELEEGESPLDVYNKLRRLVNRDILGEGLTTKEAQAKLDELADMGVSTAAIEAAAKDLREEVVDGPRGKKVQLFPDIHQVGPAGDT
jgi:hypothetical protein